MSKDDSLDLFDSKIAELREKQLVKGTVVAINDKEVLIDIGFKSEGTVHLSEFNIVPTIGEEIEIFLVVFEDRHGRLILSKEKADFERKWLKLRNAFNDETEIQGIIVKRIKGGMVVDLGGVNAFLPGSQIDVKPVTDFDSFLGKEFDFKLVKFNEMRQNIVVSRKALMSDSYDQNKKEILENIDIGMELDGVVKNITDFGAFIDLGGGMDGLLHITDITWGRINHPSDKLSLGDSIKVKVIDIDQVKNRISLGTKQLTSDPWFSIENKYTEGVKVKGKVVNIMNYGIFIELEEGIEGLVHISEFSWTKHIKHPSDIYKTGDKLEVVILSVDLDNKKISLGIKQLSDNPWKDVSNKYNVGEIYEGNINNMVANGFYVQIDDEIEGFVLSSNISWTRKIKNPSDIFKQNDKVKVQILEILSDEKKINCGIKQLSKDPWLNIEDFINENDIVDGKVLFTMDKGIVVLLNHDFEGIIPASKIKGSVEDFSVNQSLSLSVQEVSEQSRKIVLSIVDENNEEELTSTEESVDSETETK
ncbi:30S ribosomal protein S1 [Candidatus Marinimicrobia bacterium]|nr:30S ribosomal protein S1 [Candidatus Neomarinimicrobiota bacterium]